MVAVEKEAGAAAAAVDDAVNTPTPPKLRANAVVASGEDEDMNAPILGVACVDLPNTNKDEVDGEAEATAADVPITAVLALCANAAELSGKQVPDGRPPNKGVIAQEARASTVEFAATAAAPSSLRATFDTSPENENNEGVTLQAAAPAPTATDASSITIGDEPGVEAALSCPEET